MKSRHLPPTVGSLRASALLLLSSCLSAADAYVASAPGALASVRCARVASPIVAAAAWSFDPSDSSSQPKESLWLKDKLMSRSVENQLYNFEKVRPHAGRARDRLPTLAACRRALRLSGSARARCSLAFPLLPPVAAASALAPDVAEQQVHRLR